MPISCQECCERVVLSFDGENAGKDPGQLTEHLRQCRECRAFLEDLTRLRREFVSMPKAALGSSVRQQLLEAVRAEAARERGLEVGAALSWVGSLFRWPSVKWVGGVAVLALLLASWSACLYLGGQVSDLRRKLEIATQQAATAQSHRELEHPPTAPQTAMSELHEDWTEPMPRSASPRRSYF